MLPTVDGSSVQNASSASSPYEQNHAAVSLLSFSRVIAACPSLFLSNVRSIFSKMDELRLSVSCLKCDVVFITESWLNSDIADGLLYMNHFDLFRCDRTLRKGGGVCIFGPNRITSQRYWCLRHLCLLLSRFVSFAFSARLFSLFVLAFMYLLVCARIFMWTSLIF